MNRPASIGFTVQNTAGNLYVAPSNLLRKACEHWRYAAEYDDNRDEVRIYPDNGPESFSIKSSYLPKLTEVMRLAGYPIKKEAIYQAVQDGDDWRVLRDAKEYEKIQAEKAPKKPSKIVVVSIEEEPVEVRVVKEYRLPPIYEGTPADWAEACLLMAQGRPKIYIEEKIGLSVNTCLVLERSCPVFIKRLKDYGSSLQGDMAKGLARAVKESWERQLASRKSA